MEHTDTIIIGAGVIGLAIARELACTGHEVVILERADGFGTQTSARNSEVIHAGIYYPAGSLKARLCLSGRQMLYDYAQSRAIPHRRTGKLIVASRPDQARALAALAQSAAQNGVTLTPLTGDEARTLEPALACHAALLSPETGIIDSHALMTALLGEAESHGAALALNTQAEAICVTDTGFTVTTAGGYRLGCTNLINAAGLWASQVAQRIEGLNPAHIPATLYARGCYFSLPGRAAFRRLIYPLPEPGGLGIHLTLDLAGQMRFGPDVEWVEQIDYSVAPARAAVFGAAIRAYWPALPEGALQPDYAGIRPKLTAAGGTADFRIDGPERHGIPGLVNLYGIESPGLTASLALAAEVQARLTG